MTSSTSEMESLAYRRYPGQRREGILFFILFGLLGAAPLAVALDAAGVWNLFLLENDCGWLNLLGILPMSTVAFLCGAFIAMCRGTAVTIAGSQIEVVAWYGRRRCFAILPPVSVIRKWMLSLPFGRRIGLPVESLGCYVLTVGGHRACLNLDNYADPLGEAEALISELFRVAGK